MIRHVAATLAALGVFQICVAGPAAAQTVEDGRLEVLADRIEALTRQTEALANHQRRLQELEETLRAVTGQMEETRHLLDQVQGRLVELEEAQQAAAAPSPLPLPVTADADPQLPVDPPGPAVPPDHSVPAPTPPAAVSPFDDEETSYQRAYALLGRADYAGAEAAFREFIRNFPNSTLTDNAYYWLGESHYVREQYAQAAAEFARGFRSAPDKQKAPDILLKLGLSLIALGQNEDACEALNRLSLDFPDAPARTRDRAALGRESAGCS